MLRALGLSLVARRAFFQGGVVTFEMPTMGGDPTIATFTGFRGRARQTARVMGAEALELQGIAVTNPRMVQMLLRQGFTRQTVEIPEALGDGGTVEVFAKVFRMR